MQLLIVFLKVIRALYNAIAGTGNPSHVALACVLGMLAAFSPLGLTEPLNWVVLLLVLGTRAGIGLFLAAAIPFKVVYALGAWRLVEQVGYVALEGADFLKPFWQWALNLPGIALLGLDRYAAIGAVLVTVLLGAALWYPIVRAVVWLRETWVPRLNDYRLVRWVRGFWFVRAAGAVSKGTGLS